MDTNYKERIFSADFIRVLAVFFVILLHSAAPLLYKWGEISRLDWLVANTYDSISRFCVPLFIMLSGSLLLNKVQDYSTFFKKRLTKIALPFFTWISIFLLWRIFYLHENISLKSAVIIIIEGPVYYHLWYLYMLIGLYIITPILTTLTNISQRIDLKYFLSLWFIFSSIFPFMEYVFPLLFKSTLQFGIKIPLVTGYVGYYLLGSYLANHIYNKKQIRVFWFLLILSSLLTALGTFYFSTKLNTFQGILYDYFSPTVVVQSSSIFIILIHYTKQFEPHVTSRYKKWVSSLSQASLGIYLVHALILDLLLHGSLGFVLNGTTFNTWLAIPIIALVTILLSSTFSLIVMKIPLLKYTIMERRTREINK
ncbi:MAG: acyltransferase [Desulfitobacteriaceae bacterium]